jgi:hypothetical protein
LKPPPAGEINPSLLLLDSQPSGPKATRLRITSVGRLTQRAENGKNGLVFAPNGVEIMLCAQSNACVASMFQYTIKKNKGTRE